MEIYFGKKYLGIFEHEVEGDGSIQSNRGGKLSTKEIFILSVREYSIVKAYVGY